VTINQLPMLCIAGMDEKVAQDLLDLAWGTPQLLQRQ